MAKFYSAGTSGRSSGGMSLTWINGREIQKRMEQISDGLAWDDTGNLISRKTAANREMRAAAKDIAANILIPQMKRTARTAPDKIARAMAETARPMSDRIVAVRVGGVNPPLRGFKRGVGRKRSKGVMSTGRDSTSKNWRTTLAWGSEFGPWPGGRAMTKSGARGALVNHYRVPRRYPRGYWVLPAVDDVKVKAAARFGEAIDDVINKYTGGWR